MKGFLTFSLAIGAAIAWGADTPTEGTAARVEVSNALVRTLQNTKQVSFSLKWNYLPRTSASQTYLFPKTTNDRNRIKPPQSANPVTTTSINLSNAALMDAKSLRAWETKFSKDSPGDYKLLLKALSGSGSATNLKDALDKGFALWTQTSIADQLGWADLSGFPERTWQNWIRARRDFFSLYYLLGGNASGDLDPRPFGVLLTASVPPRGPATLAYREDCEWKIDIEAATTKDATMTNGFYRFYVSVKSPLVKQTFTTSTDSSVSYAVRAGLLQHEGDNYVMEPATINGTTSTDAFPLDSIVPAGSGLTQDNTSTQSVGTLTLATISNVTTTGLLDGIFNSGPARPFVGGLIGHGATTSLYGINYPLDEYQTFGILYGIVPKANNAFYVGPSLHLGIFDLSVGGRFFGRSDGSTSARWAGALSIDLASAFTKPKPPIEMKPGPSPGWLWTDIDDTATNHGLAVIEVVGSKLTDADMKTHPSVSFSVKDGDTSRLVRLTVVSKEASGAMTIGQMLGKGDQISRTLPASGSGTDYELSASDGFVIRKVGPGAMPAEIDALDIATFKDTATIRVSPGDARAFRIAVRKKPAS